MMSPLKNWSVPSALVLLVVAVAPGVSLCQEDFDTAAATPDDAPQAEGVDEQGRLLLEIGTWVAQPVGLGYVSSTHYAPSGGFPTARSLASSTDAGNLARVAYRLPDRHGSVSLDYFGHTDEILDSARNPGSFVYGETLVHPLFAGFRNDGLADGYDYEASTRTRDWSLRYNRTAFSSSSFSGTWHIGWRRLTHDRSQAAAYYTLINDLPPLPMPRPDLQPLPDLALLTSKFNGRGLETGFDVEIALIPKKLSFNAGLSAAVLRGKTDASYFSLTSLYIADLDGDLFVLGAPYDELLAEYTPEGATDPVLLYTLVSQVDVPLALRAQSVATSSHVIDTEISLRYRPRPWMEVFGGFRNAYYGGVGLDLRPESTAVTTDEFGRLVYNLQDVQEVERSTTYEGFFLGLSFFLF